MYLGGLNVLYVRDVLYVLLSLSKTFNAEAELYSIFLNPLIDLIEAPSSK